LRERERLAVGEVFLQQALPRAADGGVLHVARMQFQPQQRVAPERGGECRVPADRGLAAPCSVGAVDEALARDVPRSGMSVTRRSVQG